MQWGREPRKPELPIPQPALGQVAACEGWREAENSPETARQAALSLEELARLFAEQWALGYQFRHAREQARQAGKLPEPAGAG